MVSLRAIAISLLPGGLAILALQWALRCRHRNEMWRRKPQIPGARRDRVTPMGLECLDCHRWRPVELRGKGMGSTLTAPVEEQDGARAEKMWSELEGAGRRKALVGK